MIQDTSPAAVISQPDFADLLKPIAQKSRLRFCLAADALAHAPCRLPVVSPERRAMILYTSGTTGKPKGVVATHANIAAQIKNLVQAWGWTRDDRILNVLPMHHVHGIVNVLCCAMWAGGVCEIFPRFEAAKVWERIVQGGLTLFMAVPTIYMKLIDAWEKAPKEDRVRMSEACRRLRLMVSGSAALPVSIMEKWEKISGHVLLERYGMTEIGMGLSNPLNGQRVPGCVGVPLPGVQARLSDENGAPVAPGTPGQIEIRGDTVFLEYWRRPEDTKKAFRNGWFLTGDIAVEDNGVFRIIGRSSVDIIKTGGFKVSALEIEETLRTHPEIKECAVVGVTDPVWGERVCAALVMRGDSVPDLDAFRQWGKDRLASYKVPKDVVVLKELPKNAMGKVFKPALRELMGAPERNGPI
jgi:malonyl-CoA/methylmalonyl-CoA synthetase